MNKQTGHKSSRHHRCSALYQSTSVRRFPLTPCALIFTVCSHRFDYKVTKRLVGLKRGAFLWALTIVCLFVCLRVCVVREKDHLSVDLWASGKLHSAAAVIHIPQIKGDSWAGREEEEEEERRTCWSGWRSEHKLMKPSVLVSAGLNTLNLRRCCFSVGGVMRLDPHGPHGLQLISLWPLLALRARSQRTHHSEN